MGGSFSSMGQQQEQSATALGLATPKQPGGSDRGTARAREPPSGLLPTLGNLEVSREEGGVTWRLAVANLMQGSGCGSGGDDKQCNGGLCASRAFAMPCASLPAACKGLLTEHRWCLVCEVVAGKGRRAPGLAVSLRAEAGVGTAAEPGDADVSTGSCDCGRRQVAGHRQWLRHAFNTRQADAGLPALPAVRCRAAAAGELREDRGLELEAHLRFEGVALHVQEPLPGLVAHEAPLVLKVSEAPCLLLADSFLSPSECAEVRALGSPYVKRSKVSAGDETPLRTSWGAFLTGPLAQLPVAHHLEERVAELAVLACGVEGRRGLVLGEATQIVRYDPGQFYALHLDNRVGDCAKRAATVMIYLSDVEAGGTTSFPRSSGFPLERALEAVAAGWRNEPAPPTDFPAAARSPCAKQQKPEGLHVTPREGRAVIFWSRLPSGEEDKSSLHEACVVERGNKWIATRWCREPDELASP